MLNRVSLCAAIAAVFVSGPGFSQSTTPSVSPPLATGLTVSNKKISG